MRAFSFVSVLFMLVILLSTNACKKDPIETNIVDTVHYDTIEVSNIPSISFVDIQPSVVQEFEDSITISIKYIDGDGDLGENTADVENVFITDKRNEVTYKYRIQQLGPNESAIISGNLHLVVKNTALTGSGSSEQLQYDIYVVDRAGNQSNTITTSEITVNS